MTYTRSWCANGMIQRVRLTGEISQLKEELALLTEELCLKDARMRRITSHKRPYYSPAERMAILEIKAIRNMNASQTAKRFLVESATIANWLKRTDEPGPKALCNSLNP